MAGITDRVDALIRETVEAQGVSLWDIRYVKEGASHYLRIFIDKPEGIDINDCTNVSHAIDPILDEADPIDESYYLEVCSPGLERELTRDAHFESTVGHRVHLKLFRAVDGVKDFEGLLKSYGAELVLDCDGTEMRFERKAVAKANLVDENL